MGRHPSFLLRANSAFPRILGGRYIGRQQVLIEREEIGHHYMEQLPIYWNTKQTITDRTTTNIECNLPHPDKSSTAPSCTAARPSQHSSPPAILYVSKWSDIAAYRSSVRGRCIFLYTSRCDVRHSHTHCICNTHNHMPWCCHSLTAAANSLVSLAAI